MLFTKQCLDNLFFEIGSKIQKLITCFQRYTKLDDFKGVKMFLF